MRSDSGYKALTGSVDTGFQVVTGWNFAENAGAAARVLLRDGSGGPIFADIHLAANQSVGTEYDYPITLSVDKCYVDVTTGSIRGAVYGR